MPRITISYRRGDSLGITGRIFDRLATRYGRETIYRDIDNVPVGVDFRSHIRKALSETDVLIAVVGTKWLGPRSGASRLVNGADPVRVEIETALRNEVPLIPVLVSGAVMPSVEQLPDTLQVFAYRNALTVDAGRDFDIHMTRLFGVVDEMTGLAARATEARIAPPERSSSKRDGAAHVAVAKPLELAVAIAERDALLGERETLLAELAELRERKRSFALELNYTADETAVTQRQLDQAEFTGKLDAVHRGFAQRMIVHHVCFALLSAGVVFLSFYAFLR